MHKKGGDSGKQKNQAQSIRREPMCGFMSPGVCLLCQGVGAPAVRSAGKNRSEPQQASDTCRTDFLLDPFGERAHHTGQDPRLSDGDRGASNLLAVYPHRKMDVFSGRQPAEPVSLVCLLHSDDPDPSDRRFSGPVSGKKGDIPPAGNVEASLSSGFFSDRSCVQQWISSAGIFFPGGKIFRKCLFL